MGERVGRGAAWSYFLGDKTSLITQSVVGKLEETFRVSLVVEEKPLYLRSSCIFLLGKSYL